MRSFLSVFGIVVLALSASARAADTAVDPKKRAEANWDAVGAGKPVLHESKHFLICAPEAMAKQLKNVGELLEKHLDKAKEALKFEVTEENKGEVLPGKVTVYLFGEKTHFGSFVRRVERRRLESGETASFTADDVDLHVAVAPPRDKTDLPVEVRACEETASLLLTRRAGKNTPIPPWVVAGFGRATYYRVVPRDKAVIADRQLAANLARKYKIADVWEGNVASGDAKTMQGSLMDFLAYGPGMRVFPKFVIGFQPTDNGKAKTVAQAFDAANLTADKIDKGWKAWVRNAR